MLGRPGVTPKFITGEVHGGFLSFFNYFLLFVILGFMKLPIKLDPVTGNVSRNIPETWSD